MQCKRYIIRDLGSIPGMGRVPGGGHGNPLQYSCLGIPMDRGAWQAPANRDIFKFKQRVKVTDTVLSKRTILFS